MRFSAKHLWRRPRHGFVGPPQPVGLGRVARDWRVPVRLGPELGQGLLRADHASREAHLPDVGRHPARQRRDGNRRCSAPEVEGLEGAQQGCAGRREPRQGTYLSEYCGCTGTGFMVRKSSARTSICVGRESGASERGRNTTR